MTNYIYLTVAVLLIFGIIGCSKKSKEHHFSEGDYCVVQREEKPGYIVLKILKVDEHGYHIRTYSNVYQSIPENIEVKALKMVGIDELSDQQELSMGHLPIGKESFKAWQPKFIQSGTVDAEELEGYEMWKEAEAGYF